MPDNTLGPLQPMALQGGPIEQSVVNAMGHGLILGRGATSAEITDGVAPAVLQQRLKAHRFQFIGPDPIGVRPRGVHRLGGNTTNHTPC